jgi:hypothetical protein
MVLLVLDVSVVLLKFIADVAMSICDASSGNAAINASIAGTNSSGVCVRAGSVPGNAAVIVILCESFYFD